ncbi:MAG: acetyl-CoA carboxylase biotin carboxyl carrier protein [Phycisphaerales bacterium JB043]
MKRLKQLVDLMKDNELSELDIRDGEEVVSLKRAVASPAMVSAPAPVVAVAPPAAAPPPSPAPAPEGGGADDASDDGLVAIESPMVGTFYSASDPDTPAFVKVGDSVGPDSVVCIIEAMKVFSDVKAEISGVIEKVLVKNSEAVEFGQALFMVRPS